MKTDELKKRRDDFIEFTRKLELRESDGTISRYERDFLIKSVTHGKTPKAYIAELNAKILEIEDKKPSKGHRHTKLIAISACIVILVSFYLMMQPTLTGFAIRQAETAFTLDINQTLNSSNEYYMDLMSVSNLSTNLTSLSISGAYEGSFAVYIIEADKRLLVYSAKRGGDSSITGWVAKGDTSIQVPDVPSNDVTDDIVDAVGSSDNLNDSSDDLTGSSGSDNSADADLGNAQNFPEENGSTSNGMIPDTPHNNTGNLSHTENLSTEIIDNAPIDDALIDDEAQIALKEFGPACIDTCSINIPANISILIEVDGVLRIDSIRFSQYAIADTNATQTMNVTQEIRDKIDPLVLEKLAQDGSVRVIAIKRPRASMPLAGKGEGKVDLGIDVTAPKKVQIKQNSKKAMAAVVDSGSIFDLATMEEVQTIIIDEKFSALTLESMNITRILDVQQLGTSGQGVRICVLDTGINNDVLASQVVAGYNFVGDNEDISDDNGHGTKVVFPLVNSAPGAHLIIGKVIGQDGTGYISDIIAGLEYCAAQNSSIISMSIGGGRFEGYCDEDLVAQTVNDISANNDILVIAAAGNDANPAKVASPACARNALSVIGADKNSSISLTSNYFSASLLAAPSENILTKDNLGNPVTASGTSMAVPFVSASAALLLENENLTADEIRWRLIHTGTILEKAVPERNNTYRLFSLLNAYNAITNNITNELSAEPTYVVEGDAQQMTILSSTTEHDPSSIQQYLDETYGGWMAYEWADTGNVASCDDIFAYTTSNMYGAEDELVSLYHDGNIVGDSRATATNLPNMNTKYTFGASNDKWNVALTPSMVESDYFGAGISFYDGGMGQGTWYLLAYGYYLDVPSFSTINGVEVSPMYYLDDKEYVVKVDCMKIRVYYTEANTAQGGPTSWNWNASIDTKKVKVGTPYNWTWNYPDSMQMIPNGTPYNWQWIRSG